MASTDILRLPMVPLREAVVYLTGMSQRELYGASYRVKDKITPADLLSRTQHVIGKEIELEAGLRGHGDPSTDHIIGA